MEIQIIFIGWNMAPINFNDFLLICLLSDVYNSSPSFYPIFIIKFIKEHKPSGINIILSLDFNQIIHSPFFDIFIVEIRDDFT